MPAIIVLTYSALAHLCMDDGEFRVAPIRELPGTFNVENVILDEAHKVAASLDSASAVRFGNSGIVYAGADCRISQA